MTITLPPDLEDRLAEEARQRGTTLELLAVDLLRRTFIPTPPENPGGGTLLEFLGDYVGSIDGPAEALSHDPSQRFAEALEEKRRQGYL